MQCITCQFWGQDSEPVVKPLSPSIDRRYERHLQRPARPVLRPRRALVVNMSHSDKEQKPCCHKNVQKVRPSELPLYGNPYPPKDVILDEEPGTLENGIRSAREAATPYYSIVRASGRRGAEILSTAVAHTRSLYARISDDSSSVPKAAAITAGGLTGLLIASRKGFIRKVLYTGLGLTAAAAACYPNQSRELVDLSAYIARRRGPDLIKELLGVDVAPYLDLKKLDRIESADEATPTSSPESQSPK